MILTQSNNTNNSVALKLSEIFTILKTAYEYEDINYNKDDIDILYDIAHSLPQAYLSSDIINALKHSNDDKSTISYVFSDPHNKALIILLCYLSRIHLPFIMKNTVDKVITTTSKLILSLVDILSSLQNLNSTLLTIELSQMLVQGMWITQSPLLQLPTFTHEKVQTFKSKHIDDVFALINMENEDERKMMLNVNESELKNIADVCNRYPDISMNVTVCNTNMKTTNVFQGKENIVVVVELNREWEDNELSCVYSECYPCDKEEAWWVIVGCIKDNILISIKRVNFVKGIKLTIEFPAPEEEGHYEYKLYLLCDSWIGCDQDDDFSFEVVNMQ
jgi:pre-mRNA-splicing helicase BRR2